MTTLTAQQRQALLLDLLYQHLKGELSQGALLRTLRKDLLGYSQSVYAEKVGVSRRTLSDIERDTGNPAPAILNKVFRPLGLRLGLTPVHPQLLDKLLEGKAPPSPYEPQ